MPIWSLTKERVEKLLKQIGDTELEVDTLIKLSKEDLWNRDLDEFINEWRTQIEAEANLQKKVANMGRRASSKLKISASGPARKRKAQGEDPDDSDFGSKAVTKKPALAKRVQPKQGLLSHLSPLAKPVAKPKPVAPKSDKQGSKATSTAPNVIKPSKKSAEDVWMNLDGASSSNSAVAPIFKKTKAAVEAKKAASLEKVKSEDEDEADEEIIRPGASRQPRAAAKKVPTYNADDSDSNGDDFLFDVGKMVKGIDNASNSQTSTSRPLFSNSMSRPGSSAGLPKKSASSRQAMDPDDDDTDYSKLAPPPAAKRGVMAAARRTLLSDDDTDDEDDVIPVTEPPPKVSKVAKVAAAKPSKAKAPTAASKKSFQPPPPSKKIMPLSPAAKAYAAKKAKNAAAISDDADDEVDKIANDIMDEGEGNAKVLNDDDDDDDDDGLVVKRPARRAAAKAVENVKKAWGGDSEEDDDDDDDEEDETEESEIFDDGEESD